MHKPNLCTQFAVLLGVVLLELIGIIVVVPWLVLLLLLVSILKSP
jgi:hypothetical protein